jgi:putative transposase
MIAMTSGLNRYQEAGHLHFVTFSCHQRLPHLSSPSYRDLFESALQDTQEQHRFEVIGYVVMPEHVHLLVTEPRKVLIAAALHALKLSVGKQTQPRPFWQSRYYDFNVFSRAKLVEKLNYIHWNPVKRGLVRTPEDWRWSSCFYYKTGAQGPVRIVSDHP